MPLGLAPACVPTAAKASHAAPPPNFRGAEGVRSAWLIGEGPFGRTPSRGGTPAQRQGRRYERHALEHLSRLLGSRFTAGPWFQFYDDSGLRYCQPDGIYRFGDGIAVFECKLTFTSDAYYQLRKLYEPIVRLALRPQSVLCCVVCRAYDPAIPYPEEVEVTDLGYGWQVRGPRTIVYEFRP